MCLQCLTESVTYMTEEEQEVFPGWALMQATRDYSDEWLAGEWGLVQRDDPAVTWNGLIYSEPIHGEDEVTPELYAWDKEVIKLHDALDKLNFQESRDLVKALEKTECPIQENSLIISEWLMNHFAKWIETHPAT